MPSVSFLNLDNLGFVSIYAAAFLLGAIHSLEPGHGKTVVAAYLVGTKCRNWDAIILGLTVTFAHTFSILSLGIIAKLTSVYFSEQMLHIYLGAVASLIILILGIWMLKSRWILIKKRPPREDLHSHPHGEHTHHRNDEHNHGDADVHRRDHHLEGSALHSHHHPHPHDCGVRALGFTGLILLGISGGIIPCPAALAILLAAAASGNIAKGLSLVILFSLGLAFALVSLGLIVVNGFRLTKRFLNSDQIATRMAFASAVIVTILGIVTFLSSLRHLLSHYY